MFNFVPQSQHQEEEQIHAMHSTFETVAKTQIPTTHVYKYEMITEGGASKAEL